MSPHLSILFLEGRWRTHVHTDVRLPNTPLERHMTRGYSYRHGGGETVDIVLIEITPVQTHTHTHIPLCFQTSLMKANSVCRRTDPLYINKHLPVCSWGVTLYLRLSEIPLILSFLACYRSVIPNLSHFFFPLFVIHFMSFSRSVPLSLSSWPGSESHDRGCSGWITMKLIRTCGHKFTYTWGGGGIGVTLICQFHVEQSNLELFLLLYKN